MIDSNNFELEEVLIALDLLEKCQLFIKQLEIDLMELNKIILLQKL